jgi:hypothetical protein
MAGEASSSKHHATAADAQTVFMKPPKIDRLQKLVFYSYDINFEVLKRMSRYLSAPTNELYSELAAIQYDLIQIRRDLLVLKYSPSQPRIPAGNPDGAQWSGGQGEEQGDMPQKPEPGAMRLSARRISREREAFCEQQYKRDTFHCTMVGLVACHSQAMLRYSNCLNSRQVPPLNY